MKNTDVHLAAFNKSWLNAHYYIKHSNLLYQSFTTHDYNSNG